MHCPVVSPVGQDIVEYPDPQGNRIGQGFIDFVDRSNVLGLGSLAIPDLMGGHKRLGLSNQLANVEGRDWTNTPADSGDPIIKVRVPPRLRARHWDKGACLKPGGIDGRGKVLGAFLDRPSFIMVAWPVGATGLFLQVRNQIVGLAEAEVFVRGIFE